MAKTLPYKRIICAFQPHTYTRTKALFDDFVKELLVPDVVVLAEIFAAREQNTIGISSMDLCREIPGSVYCPTLDKVTAALARICSLTGRRRSMSAPMLWSWTASSTAPCEWLRLKQTSGYAAKYGFPCAPREISGSFSQP